MNFLSILRNMFIPPQSFSNNDLEYDFLRDYGQKFVYHRRAAIIIGLCTWTLYIGWDFFHAYMNLEFSKFSIQIYVLRLVGIAFLSVTAWIMSTSTGVNENKATIVLSSGGFSCYLLLLLMIHILPFPYNYLYYYIGLLLVLFFIYGLMRLRARNLYILSILFLVSSSISFCFDKTVSISSIDKTQSIVNGYYWSAAMTYLVSFMMVGCAIAVELERTARQTFYREKELRDANKETENRTAALVLLKDEAAKLSEQKNRDKSKFLADVVHDWNNSMQAISYFLEPSLHAIRQGNLHKSQELIENLSASVKTMNASFRSALDISKLESGLLEIDYSNFDIYDFLEEVVKNMQPFALTRNVNLRTTKRRNHFTFVKSDRNLLNRVLTNLISNAIKYSDVAKFNSVTIVSIVCFPQYIRVEVLDNGIGIPESEIQNIFNPFTRLNNYEKNKIQGLGLGLSVVNTIINSLDEHRIEVTSREGRWTRFSIDLPSASESVVENSNEGTDYNSPLNYLENLYILLIEDNFLVRKATLELLLGNGAICEVAESLEDLLQILPKLERDPDVVLTDYRLPNGNTAVDVIDAVKKNLGEDIPFLIITGESTTAKSDESLQFIQILNKPVTPIDLINNIIKARRLT